MSPEIATVCQLIERTAIGDQRAFSRLHAVTRQKVYRVAVAILRNDADAEEAVQEIYLKVWRHAGRFVAGGSSPISWLAKIARNHALDVLRARRPASCELDLQLDLEDPQPNPEADAIQRDRARHIDLSLRLLRPRDELLVRDAYVAGYRYDEVATRHTMPINTVRTVLKRSLRKMREAQLGLVPDMNKLACGPGLVVQ